MSAEGTFGKLKGNPPTVVTTPWRDAQAIGRILASATGHLYQSSAVVGPFLGQFPGFLDTMVTVVYTYIRHASGHVGDEGSRNCPCPHGSGAARACSPRLS